MSKRYKMTKQQSKNSFAENTKTKSVNSRSIPMRGGFRL